MIEVSFQEPKEQSANVVRLYLLKRLKSQLKNQLGLYWNRQEMALIGKHAEV